MRLLLFLNNWNGWEVAKWLRQREENIVGLVLNAPGDQRFGDEILAALDMPEDKIWYGHQIREPETMEKLRELKPDMGISASFAYLLKRELIELFPRGCINLHAALLPYNGGWYTNVWPILDGSPAGATVHYIDAGVDSGDIIAQRETKVEPTDTAGTLHEKITRDLIELFKENWPAIREGRNSRTPQDRSKATAHRKNEIEKVSLIDLDRNYRAGDLINLLRARTYPPYPSAYYLEDGKRTYLRIQLLRDNELATVAGGKNGTKPLSGDLTTEWKASELIEHLGAHNSSVNHFIRLPYRDEPIFARVEIVDEKEFRPAASPAWMGKP